MLSPSLAHRAALWSPIVFAMLAVTGFAAFLVGGDQLFVDEDESPDGEFHFRDGFAGASWGTVLTLGMLVTPTTLALMLTSAHVHAGPDRSPERAQALWLAWSWPVFLACTVAIWMVGVGGLGNGIWGLLALVAAVLNGLLGLGSLVQWVSRRGAARATPAT